MSNAECTLPILPIDAAYIIFENMRNAIPSAALVCKAWKEYIDGNLFRDRLRPRQTFGAMEWKKYLGVDAGEEPLLPRCAYANLAVGNHLLTFIPDKVKLFQEDGSIEEVMLDNLKAIGKLIKNLKTGNKINYSPYSWSDAMLAKLDLEKPHWVWINKKVIGRREIALQQLIWAQKTGGRISGLVDTVVSMFMEYIRTGERSFIYDQLNDARTYLRVDKCINWSRVGVSYTAEGLLVGNRYLDDAMVQEVGVVVARKAFSRK